MLPRNVPFAAALLLGGSAAAVDVDRRPVKCIAHESVLIFEMAAISDQLQLEQRYENGFANVTDAISSQYRFPGPREILRGARGRVAVWLAADAASGLQRRKNHRRRGSRLVRRDARSRRRWKAGAVEGFTLDVFRALELPDLDLPETFPAVEFWVTKRGPGGIANISNFLRYFQNELTDFECIFSGTFFLGFRTDIVDYAFIEAPYTVRAETFRPLRRPSRGK